MLGIATKRGVAVVTSYETEKIDAEFDVWWHDEGSGLCPLPDEDAETHVRRVSKIAWANAAFLRESPKR